MCDRLCSQGYARKVAFAEGVAKAVQLLEEANENPKTASDSKDSTCHTTGAAPKVPVATAAEVPKEACQAPKTSPESQPFLDNATGSCTPLAPVLPVQPLGAQLEEACEEPKTSPESKQFVDNDTGSRLSTRPIPMLPLKALFSDIHAEEADSEAAPSTPVERKVSGVGLTPALRKAEALIAEMHALGLSAEDADDFGFGQDDEDSQSTSEDSSLDDASPPGIPCSSVSALGVSSRLTKNVETLMDLVTESWSTHQLSDSLSSSKAELIDGSESCETEAADMRPRASSDPSVMDECECSSVSISAFHSVSDVVFAQLDPSVRS
jgi:hypothetical protein